MTNTLKWLLASQKIHGKCSCLETELRSFVSGTSLTKMSMNAWTQTQSVSVFMTTKMEISALCCINQMNDKYEYTKCISVNIIFSTHIFLINLCKQQIGLHPKAGDLIQSFVKGKCCLLLRSLKESKTNYTKMLLQCSFKMRSESCISRMQILTMFSNNGYYWDGSKMGLKILCCFSIT